MEAYSDIHRAVCQPQYRPGQPVRICTHQHQSKLHSRYSLPQIIHRQGPSTYQSADGRKWDATNLTKTNIYPRIEEDDYSDWDDDFPTLHPHSSTLSLSMSPVPPAASVSFIPPVVPATPASWQAPEFPIHTTPPVSPVTPDNHIGFVSASSRGSECSSPLPVSPLCTESSPPSPFASVSTPGASSLVSEGCGVEY